MERKTDRREFLRATVPSGGFIALSPSPWAIGSTPRQQEGEGRQSKSRTQPYLSAAREFLETITEQGIDRYGEKNTPVFCLALDPEKYSPPRPPDKIDRDYARGFEYLYRDFGYYWKTHLHGSNLIYDQGTIRALYALEDATGEKKYARKADNYLQFFLENMVSQQTGMFGWGEHIFYNVFLDYLIGGAFQVRAWRRFFFGHELERWTTIYDLLWERDPEKTRAEIEAIYEYKVLDRETFINNRHSDFYSGRVNRDVLTFIKHTGLFAHAFAFLYSKTGDPEHQEWARKMADLFWKERDPKTDLVRPCIQRLEEHPSPGQTALLELFLLRAYQWHPESLFLERALAYIKSYHRYFTLGDRGNYRALVKVDGTDGAPGRFAEYWEGPIRQAKAAILAYSLSGDTEALDLAAHVITNLASDAEFDTQISRSRISDEIEAKSCALSTAIDLYEVTGRTEYLIKAQELGNDAIARFLYRGLFVSRMQVHPETDESATSPIYDARSGAGWLALNLIRLQRNSDLTQAGAFRVAGSLDRRYD